MSSKLEEKLNDIEKKLGSTEPTPEVADKLGWHLDKIESLIEGGGSEGGTKLYKHNVFIVGANNNFSIHLISEKSEELDYLDDTICDDFISAKYDNGYGIFSLSYIYADVDDVFVLKDAVNNDIRPQSFGNVVSISDTVTPL